MSRVIFVGGPSGTGKSTISILLSKKLDCPFIEGDEFHPQANIDKMSQGIPLTDEDRWGWLSILCQAAISVVQGGENTVVVSCSMLKKKYRDYIKETIGTKAQTQLFVLYNDFSTIYKRMETRSNHYMKANMLKSQFDDLEVPELEDHVYKVFCGTKEPEQIFVEILKYINL
ncbi:hypothetical protein FOA43_000268 [Brettanomyces nanus]|uniref:Gluconokinase n=1 Tax=Eeniella nana TaxID=13502 RepID=A0A875S0I2_EENNA|nr:uncharacterized protein FOA43_000268 [Brettanomyces nanus]QPG72964.1 hypothetical protein FOA43_000268 [Brettanomyces nanus]